jgi:chromate transporter
MPSLITPQQLARRVGLPDAPVLIDVRTAEDAAADPRLLPGSLRRDHRDVAAWAPGFRGRDVVAVCHKGLKLSEGAAAWLRHEGARAEVLDGGFLAWAAAGLPLVADRHIPARDAAGRTVWVTRARPKVDRIACPWLIRRFVDPDAVFLFVAPSEVAAVADRFGATPFDIERVFWSHRGAGCTFDTMLEEFGLSSPALDRLALLVRGADTGAARPRAAMRGAAGGLARAVAAAPGRPGAARGRAGAVRRLPPVVPRRYGGDPQLAGAGTALMDTPTPPAAAFPTFREALRVWTRIGLLSFGGPAAQIALMHREVVDERRWISDARFLHALNFCMLLPGPEAQQLATYLGWLMHGVRGGLAAGLLFIAPGVAVMMVLSLIYATLGAVPAVAALFFGLKCAVLVLVIEALLKVARRALKGLVPWLAALAAFLALFVFSVPFPIVVLAALAAGFAAPQAFAASGHGAAKEGPPAMLDALMAAEPDRVQRMTGSARRAGLVALAVWAWPVALLAGSGVFGDIAWFFSKMAVVTVGGAYAVLAYVAQEAVEHYRWLSAPDMLAGLGLAETTPGPLILVLQFVGFLAGYREAGVLGGIGGALLTVLVTFAPCFAWIFLGAPFVERLHAQPRLKGALAGVTAAVVGVIANLALWFGLRVVFARVEEVRVGPITLDVPDPLSLIPDALALTALAAVCHFVLKLGVVRTLAVTSAASFAARTLLGF